MKRLVQVLFSIGFTICLVMGIMHFTKQFEPKSEPQIEKVLQIHKGKFAFCGASGAVPTGKKITVQGRVFDEGCAICPVLEGPSIANLAMYGDGGTWGKLGEVEGCWGKSRELVGRWGKWGEVGGSGSGRKWKEVDRRGRKSEDVGGSGRTWTEAEGGGRKAKRRGVRVHGLGP